MPQLRSFGCPLLCAVLIAVPLAAQDGDRIWGRVHTSSGDVFEGFIRWDRNEGSWVDILDGTKDIPEENYDAWLASQNVDGPPVRTIDLAGYRISWDEDDPDFPESAQSGVRFGHIASLRVTGRDEVELELRSGERLTLSGGSTDMGPSMRDLLVDIPGGDEVELEWEELERVEFSAAPAGARARSSRLHGTVRDVEGGEYTGYISWDLDEILEDDILDGEERESGDDFDVRMGDIVSMERLARGDRVSLTSGYSRLRDGVRVTLRDGRTVELTGTNDVDRGNRGIHISDPRLGVVALDWREFAAIRFHESEETIGYDAFDGGHPLQGTVVTQSGEEIAGMIRWDADEGTSWELLNGQTREAGFTIEFALVSRIVRGEVFGAEVTLTDGRTFELEDSNDVEWDNKGILVAPQRAETNGGAVGAEWRVVPWDEFREVRFHHGASEGSGG